MRVGDFNGLRLPTPWPKKHTQIWLSAFRGFSWGRHLNSKVQVQVVQWCDANSTRLFAWRNASWCDNHWSKICKQLAYSSWSCWMLNSSSLWQPSKPTSWIKIFNFMSIPEVRELAQKYSLRKMAELELVNDISHPGCILSTTFCAAFNRLCLDARSLGAPSPLSFNHKCADHIQTYNRITWCGQLVSSPSPWNGHFRAYF